MNYTLDNILIRILRWFYRKTSPADMEMVKYWKTGASVQAKVTKAPDGSTIMIMEGEKYPFPGYPRGHILFGYLSKIKHEIKNQIFNESWGKLEGQVDKKEIIQDIKSKLFGNIMELAKQSKYDQLPPNAMCVPVREIYRAWTKVSPETWELRDLLCFILQEDDSYRFRVQWLSQWFGLVRFVPVKCFDRALSMMENAEVVGDMKERMRLLRRILMLALEDPTILKRFNLLFKEIDWKKVRLSAGDKYHFRGKYFKVDLKNLEY